MPLPGHMCLFLEDGPFMDRMVFYMDRWAPIWQAGLSCGQDGLLCGQGGLLSGQMGPYIDIWAFIWKMHY